MKNRILTYSTLPFISLSLLGCNVEKEDEDRIELPITSSQAALTATDNSEKALNGLLDAVDFLADSGTFSEVFDTFNEDILNEEGCAEDEQSCLKIAAPDNEMNSEAQDLRNAIAELIDFLRQEVFIDNNLESSTNTSATYLLGPDLLCDDEFGIDRECIKRVQFVQPRLRLTSPQDGDVDITLLVGSAKHEPIQFQVYAQNLGVQVDLGQSLAFAKDLGTVSDELQAIAGVVQVQLVKNTEQNYTVQLNILEPLNVSVLTEQDEEVSILLGASSPALALNANGNTETLELLQDWKQFLLVAPLAAFADPTSDDEGYDDNLTNDDEQPEAGNESEPQHVYTGMIELLVAGLSSTISYAAESDEISVSNFGFGDKTSTLKHDGNVVAALDLNANAARRVALALKALEGRDGIAITFDPSFEAKLEFAFDYVANQFEDLPEFLLNDTLGLSFTGAAPTLELTEDKIAVTSGSLSLTSEAVSTANITVNANQCLGDAVQSESQDHELLSALAIVSCQ